MLKKSTLREIRTSLARYLAIFAIVALGVGFFAGLKDCKPSMVRTATAYLEDHNFYDYMIASSYGIDDESVDMAKKWDGVSGAEGTIQIDVIATSGNGDAQSLKAISLPKDINTLNVTEGRLPEKKNECVVDAYSITDAGYTIGDKIVITDENEKDTRKKFRNREFEIVGKVNTPIYLDYQRGSTDIGNGSLDTFFYVKEDVFDVDYYTSLYVTLDGEEAPFTDELEDKLDASEDSMEDLAEAITAARRETARKEAQEELDEKKQEYEDNLADYNREKADTEKKIRDAEKKINKGYKTINSKKKEINKQIKDAGRKKEELQAAIPKLDDGIKQAEKGISEAEAKLPEVQAGLKEAKGKKEQLDQAHEAGLMDDASYKAAAKEAKAAIKQLEGAEKEIRNGISSGKKTLKELKSQKKQAQAGIKEIDAGVKKAKAGLRTLKSKKAELDRSAKKLRSEKRKADDEFAKAEKELDDAKEKIDEAQEDIDEMETGNSYAFSRGENAGYSSFDSNSSIVSNIAKIFPVFFFLIAALVCMTTMTRMVDEQRTQIGVLKALGYSNAAIVGKYMFYSGSAAFLGAVVGFFAGCKIFPTVIWNAYTMMYDFSHSVDYVIDPVLGLVSLAAALLCSMGATWVSISQDFRVSPSDLIRPKTPPAGKRILMERITPLWNRISFLYKVSIRNIFRDKKRFFMMVIGVSGCTALLIAGMGIRTTIARVADYQFGEISLYDYVTVFSKNMNEKRQNDFFKFMAKKTDVTEDEILFLHQAEVTLVTDQGNCDVTCTAGDPERLGKFIDLHEGETHIDYPGDGEVVIVRKLNHDYGINVGDEITIREGYREMTAKVTGVADNYVYDSIYMTPATYEKGFGKKATIKSALVRLPDETEEEVIRAAATRSANYEYTAAVSVNLDVRDNVGKMMESLNDIVYVVILSAALLAFIVLYNLTNINITERIREIATIKVLGFRQLEVSQYVFRENLFLTAIAAVVGIPMGKWLLKFVIDNIVVKMIFFVPRLTRMDIVISIILTFVFAAAVNLAMQRRLRNVSMTESLKSVE